MRDPDKGSRGFFHVANLGANHRQPDDFGRATPCDEFNDQVCIVMEQSSTLAPPAAPAQRAQIARSLDP